MGWGGVGWGGVLELPSHDTRGFPTAHNHNHDHNRNRNHIQLQPPDQPRNQPPNRPTSTSQLPNRSLDFYVAPADLVHFGAAGEAARGLLVYGLSGDLAARISGGLGPAFAGLGPAARRLAAAALAAVQTAAADGGKWAVAASSAAANASQVWCGGSRWWWHGGGGWRRGGWGEGKRV